MLQVTRKVWKEDKYSDIHKHTQVLIIAPLTKDILSVQAIFTGNVSTGSFDD